MKPSDRDIRLNRTAVCLALVAVLLVLPFANAPAALSAPLVSTVNVSPVVGFEGFLADDGAGGKVADGQHQLTFTVWDAAAGGTDLWHETQLIQVTGGLYSVALGTANPLTTTSPFNPTGSGKRWIGVKVDANLEIVPRTLVTSVPFALNADHANSVDSASSVPWSGITGMTSGAGTGITISVGNSISLLSQYQLPPGCLAGQVVQSTGGGWNCLTNVTTGSGANGQVVLWGPSNALTGNAGLLSANGTLTVTNGLNIGTASGATLGQIRASGTVTGSNLSGNNTGDVTLAGQAYLSLSPTGQVITANPVNLSNGNVTGYLAATSFPALTGDVATTNGSLSTSIATGAVTTTKIASGAVTSAKLASGAVTSAAIANGAVGSTQIASGAVGTTQINNSQVQGRVTGSCAAGIGSINTDGTVACSSAVTGSGTANHLAYFNGTNSVASTANVTTDGSSVTMSGGLNVNTSGAAAGTIRAAGRVYPNGQGGVGYAANVQTITNTGVAQIFDVPATTGFLIVADVSSGNSAIYMVRGGLHTTTEVSDPDNHFTPTKGSALSINIYWDPTNARYEIQNTTGGTHALYMYILAV